MFKGIDLFSDTLTLPTTAMKKAMLDAPLGDEQKGEDSTTRALEEKVAELLNQEAALFFPSATMANQVAIRALCQPGDIVIAASNSHIFYGEAGGIAIHAQALANPIATTSGIFTGADIEQIYVTNKGAHFPISRLVSIENTTNMGGGKAWRLDELDAVRNTCQKLGLYMHLDGARLFNAHIKTGLSLPMLTRGITTVTICLSKGLGCPMGAVLTFPEALYEQIRRFKQIMGGSMRQSGIVAAAGIYALNHHVERLQIDHENAFNFAQKLAEIPEIQVENAEPETNMVFFQWHGKQLTPDQFLEKCIQNGLRFSRPGTNRFRAITHLDITREMIDEAITIIKEISRKNH